MTETQQTVGTWISETFPGGDPESPRKSLRMIEEAVELCLASGASPQDVHEAVGRALAGFAVMHGRHARKPLPAHVPVEAADVLIVLLGLAHMRGFDLWEQVDLKMKINRQRRWAARGDGTGYHVKDTP